MSSFPPSQSGRKPLIPVPIKASASPRTDAIKRDWQNTARPFSLCPAPTNWATCTEKPVPAAMHSPLSNQVELEIRPMDAEALAPKLPTIVASIYCMIVVLSWARTAGMLSPITICSCSLRGGVCPFCRY